MMASMSHKTRIGCMHAASTQGLVELSVRNTERGNPELLKSFRVQYQGTYEGGG